MLDTTGSRSARRAASAALVAGSLLLATACGSGTEPASPLPTGADGGGAAATSAPAAAPQAAPPTSAASPEAGSQKPPRTATAELPWPASATAAAELQRRADAGSQPWLLDPLDVAQAYATAVHGWRAATVSSAGTDQVRISAAGSVVLVTLDQPARSGNGGIWVVTGERPA